MPNFKIGLIRSEFNLDLVNTLVEGAKHQLELENIDIVCERRVPGAAEIPLTGSLMLKAHQLDGLLACGVVLRGETTHYDSICRILENGLIHLQMTHSLPIIFSVLFAENRNQASARLGGAKGHRGKEAVQTLKKMLELKT